MEVRKRAIKKLEDNPSSWNKHIKPWLDQGKNRKIILAITVVLIILGTIGMVLFGNEEEEAHQTLYAFFDASMTKFDTNEALKYTHGPFRQKVFQDKAKVDMAREKGYRTTIEDLTIKTIEQKDNVLIVNALLHSTEQRPGERIVPFIHLFEATLQKTGNKWHITKMEEKYVVVRGKLQAAQ